MKPITLTHKQVQALRDRALAEQRKRSAQITKVVNSKKIYNRKKKFSDEGSIQQGDFLLTDAGRKVYINFYVGLDYTFFNRPIYRQL